MSNSNCSTYTFNFNITLPAVSNEASGSTASVWPSYAGFTTANKQNASNPFGMPTTHETKHSFNFSTSNATPGFNFSSTPNTSSPGQNFNFSFNFTIPTNSNSNSAFSKNGSVLNPFALCSGTDPFLSSRFPPVSNTFNNPSQSIFSTAVNNFNSKTSNETTNSFHQPQNIFSNRSVDPFIFSSSENFNKTSANFNQTDNTLPDGKTFPIAFPTKDSSNGPSDFYNPKQKSTSAGLSATPIFNSPPTSYFKKVDTTCKTNPLDIPLPANFQPIGSVIKFNPPTYPVLSERYNTITCMKDYEFYSQEELRLQDYQSDRKGKQKDVLTLMKERPTDSYRTLFGSSSSSLSSNGPNLNTSLGSEQTQFHFDNNDNQQKLDDNETQQKYDENEINMNHSEDQSNLRGNEDNVDNQKDSPTLSVDSENFVLVPKETAFDANDEAIPEDDNLNKEPT